VVEEGVRWVSGEQNTSAVRRFFCAVWSCFLLVFAPAKFKALEDEDNAQARALDKEKTPEQIAAEREPRHLVVRRALVFSFLVVVFAAIIGWVVGRLVGWIGYCAVAWWIGFLQIAATGLLLWGVLFVRGWEIQSWGGNTLGERVNRWLYRFLSFVGTLLLVVAISLPPCP
jgi:hypothetical protein